MSCHAQRIVDNLLSNPSTDPWLVLCWLHQGAGPAANIRAIANVLAGCAAPDWAVDQLQCAIDYGNGDYDVEKLMARKRKGC